MTVAGVDHALGSTKQRIVLAVLLLESGRLVTTAELVDRVWDTTPPADAHGALASYVSRLRRALVGVRDAGGPATELGRRQGGYRLDVDPDLVDVHRFGRLAAEAAEPRTSDEDRARLLREALALWRGGPLDDLRGRWADGIRESLTMRRLEVVLEWARAELRLGRPQGVLGTVRELLAEHPFVEPLAVLLMQALSAAGRDAEALDVYHAVRTRLVDELGAEPGPDLRAVFEAVLRGHERRPVAHPAGNQVIPRTLPRDLPGFTGRASELAELDGVLANAAASVALVAVVGTAGVGKTALAVHWAHRVADRFPDGQVYLDLRGYATRSPLRLAEALGVLLRAFGVRADRVPVDVAEAAARYRSLLADRRVLLILDNASSAEQVRPLLPGGRESLVLVTSRERLGGLIVRDDARRLTLDVLPQDESVRLLVHLVGEERTRAELAQTAELAAVCVNLPLALRIAAAHLVDRPHRLLAGYVDELRRGNRLTALAIDGDEDVALGATLELSYRTIPADAQRMFRLMGLLPGTDLSVTAAAALAGLAPVRAAALLDRLARAHLIHEHAPERYSFHDLLRQYARDRVTTDESPDEQAAALGRLLNWYLGGIAAARGWLSSHGFSLSLPDTADLPGFADHAAALAWLDVELPNLVAAVERAAADGPKDMAWRLADGLRGYLSQRGYLAEWFTINGVALAAAEAEEQPRAQAAMHCRLAEVSYRLGRNGAALEHLTTAQELVHATGWTEAEGHIIGNHGIVLQQTGRARAALARFTEALAVHQRLGLPVDAAVALNNLANMHRQLGHLRAGLTCASAALDVYRATGTGPAREVAVLETLSSLHRELGRPRQARALAEEAVAKSRAIGNSHNEAMALVALASAHTDLADYVRAQRYAEAGLSLSAEAENRRAHGMALNVLATVLSRLGRRSEAAELFEQTLAEPAHGYETRIGALIGLAGTERRSGAAIEHAHEALARAEDGDFRILAGRALSTLAVLLFRIAPAKAAGYARRALDYGYRSGHRLDVAHAHLVLSTCLAGAASERHRQAALRIHAAVGVSHAEYVRVLRDGGRGQHFCKVSTVAAGQRVPPPTPVTEGGRRWDFAEESRSC